MLKKEIFLNHILIVFVMAALFLLGTAATASALDGTDADIDSGTCDNVPWRITADYELVIGEKGQEYTFDYKEQRSSSSYSWRKYRSEIKEVTVLGTVHGSGSFVGMFYDFSVCTSMDLRGFETSQVTNMGSMFEYCEKLISANVSSFDTSNVTGMYWMFSDCESLINLDVSGFDTGKVTNICAMFGGCHSLPSIDVSGFDTSKVKNMSFMFGGCSRLTNINVSGFDTGQVTDISSLFYNCKSLTSVDLSGLDTSQVNDMSGMFGDCESLAYVNLSGLSTGNNCNMEEMFRDCVSLTNVDLSGLDTSRVGDMSSMFSGCESLVSVDLSGIDVSNVRTMGGLFSSCTSMANVKLFKTKTGEDCDLSGMFGNCTSLTSLDLSVLDTSNVRKMNGMFRNCTSLTGLNLSVLDTSNIRGMSAMFEGCASLTSLDLSALDTSKVTSMIDLFYGCSSLTSINLTGIDTSEVTDMSHMFRECSALTRVDLSGFKTSNVDDMDYMFYNCSSLTSVNVSGIDTSKVEYMRGMFSGCTALTNVDISDLDTTKAYTSGMFSGCSSLITITLPESLRTMGTYAFNGCESLKEVEIGSLELWCAIRFTDTLSNPLNASPDAVLTINGGTGSKVTLEEGITAIPDRTFSSWAYLKEVTLPKSLMKIGAGAFEGTDSLRTVNVDSLTQWLSISFAADNSSPLDGGMAELRIGSGSDYMALDKADIDKTIGSIPAYAFSGCRSLRSVVIPDSVTTIGTGAFASCNLLSQVVIPDSVSVLPEDLFRGCTDLKKILIPDSVTDIDMTAFNGHSKDLVLYGTPGSAAEAFANLQGISFRDYSEYDAMLAGTITENVRWILTGGSQLTIEGSGKDILPDYEAGASPIAGIADKVTSIKIKGISGIGAGVFSGFTNLERVTIDINTTIEAIDPAAFAGCSNVEVCCYQNSYDRVVQATSDLPGFTMKKLSGSRAGNVTWTFNEDTGTLLLTSASEEFGETFTESPFKDLDVRRVEFSDSFSCRDLPANLFAGCSSLTEVQLAAQTIEIGEAAFKDCTNLRRVTWHDGITKIGEGVLENCINLQQVLLADSVLVNEYDQEMEDLSIEIPEGVKVIPENAFRNCSAIREVDWYEDAENEQGSGSIGASAFANCSNLAEIGMPDYVERIGEAAFKGCTALSQQDGELAFSENLDVLGKQAFYDCSQIQTMSFEKDLSSIGEESLGVNKKLIVEGPESASKLKAYCRNAGMTFITTEGMGDTETQQDAYVRLAKSSVTVKAGKSKKIAYSTNGKVKGIKASGTNGKVSVTKSGHKVKFKGKSAKSGFRVSLKFDMKKAKDVTKSVSVTVKKASSGLGAPEGEEQIISAGKKTITFSSDAAASQKVRITRPDGAEEALVCTASKRGIVKYVMKDDGTLRITPAKAGKTTLTIYAEADEMFARSEPIRITVTVKARPAKVTAKVKKLSKKKARVSWKKVSGVKSYQIQVSVRKNFKKKKTYTAKSSATKKVVKITKGKKNYVRVRYKLANGKVGKWSTTLVVKK